MKRLLRKAASFGAKLIDVLALQVIFMILRGVIVIMSFVVAYYEFRYLSDVFWGWLFLIEGVAIGLLVLIDIFVYVRERRSIRRRDIIRSMNNSER